jgi:hypothetical protein
MPSYLCMGDGVVVAGVPTNTSGMDAVVQWPVVVLRGVPVAFVAGRSWGPWVGMARLLVGVAGG